MLRKLLRMRSGERHATSAYVYIVQCADGSYYTGLTHHEPTKRESEHNLGLDQTAWTYARRPVRLVWSEHFLSIIDAIETERRVKGWRREKKEALIRGAYTSLPMLASRAKGSRPRTSS